MCSSDVQLPSVELPTWSICELLTLHAPKRQSVCAPTSAARARSSELQLQAPSSTSCELRCNSRAPSSTSSKLPARSGIALAAKVRAASSEWSRVASAAPSSEWSLELAAMRAPELQQVPELRSCCEACCCVAASSKLLLLNLNLKKNELCDLKKMFTWVLRGFGSSRSKLQVHSNFQAAPSSLPLNVFGARSFGDGVRGEGLVGGR